MEIYKEELVLYSLSILESDERPHVKYSREDLAYALDISMNTLDLYFTKLKNQHFVIRHKKKFYDDLRQTIETTPEGKKRIMDIQRRIDLEVLTPERHMIPSTIKITTILKRIDDDLERIFFLALFTRVKRFDLPFFLETIKTAKEESNMVHVLKEFEQKGEGVEEIPVLDMFFKTKLYIEGYHQIMEQDRDLSSNVNALLIVGEANTRQARYNDARAIYEYILSPRIQTNQNQWFMARAGLALLTSKMGDIEDAVVQLEDLMSKVDNKIQKAYCKQLIARILSTTQEHEKAMSLFHSAIRSFNAMGIPLLLCMSFNNLGILYFRMNDHKEAERSWKKASQYAKEINNLFLQAIINTNLADISILKGELPKGKKYLDRAMEKFQEASDYEGIAYVNLNYSFYYLEMKEFYPAKEHFFRALEIAPPFPSPQERKEMKEMFIERAVKNGFEEELFLNIDHMRDLMT